MDRRFFENINNEYIENSDNKDFQKKEDKLYDSNDNNSNFFQLDYSVSDEYEVENKYFDISEITDSDDKYFEQENVREQKCNCECDNRYFETDGDERLENLFDDRYYETEEDIEFNDECKCDKKYLKSNKNIESEYECKLEFDNKYIESCDDMNLTENYEVNQRSYDTFEDKKNNKCKDIYCNGNKIGYKEGYKAGYDDGVRDAIKEAYKAGLKRGFRLGRYRC